MSRINNQEIFIKITNNLNNLIFQHNYNLSKMSNKIISFYIIILITNLFCWYYISCFCVVYKNTQKYMLLDFLYAILFNLIFSIFSCLIKASIKFIFIKSEYGKYKGIIFNILKSDYIYFLFEFILEIIVCSKIL